MGFFDSVGSAIGSVASNLTSVPGLIGTALGGPVGGYVGGAYNYLNEQGKQDAAAQSAYNQAMQDLISAQAQQVKDAQAYAESENKRAEERHAAWKADQEAKAQKEAAEQKAQESKAAQTKDELIKQSQEFDKNAPGMASNEAAIGDTQSLQNLNQQVKDVTRSANQRGLLYSGLRQGAEQGLRGAAAGEMAANRADINERTAAQGDLYRKLASEGTRENEGQLMQNYQNRVQNSQNIYQQGLQARRAALGRNQGVTSLYNQQTGFQNQARGAETPASSGFMPQAFAAGGQLLGAGAHALANRRS